VITSSLSFIYVQIFRLLLKISVYERHQLRFQTIYQASCEEAITLLDLVGSKYTLGSFAMYLHRETSPNLSKSIFSPNYWQLNSSRAQKWETLQKMFWCQQHPVFPGGHPSKYWLGSMLLNFSDRTRTGVFNMIWPLARAHENVKISFEQHTHMPTYNLHICDFAHRLGWNVGLNLDYFYNYPLASWAFPAVSNPWFLAFLVLSTFMQDILQRYLQFEQFQACFKKLSRLWNAQNTYPFYLW
jgi:hypothetical protein